MTSQISATECVSGEVETPDERRLLELAEVFRREHELAVEHGRKMIAHVIAAGEALLEAKKLVPPGEWTAWTEKNIPAEGRKALTHNAMRLAALKEHVDHDLSISANLRLLRGIPGQRKGIDRVSAEIKEEALRLYATGALTKKEIAQTVGVSATALAEWIDPERAKRKNEKVKAWRNRRRGHNPPLPPPESVPDSRRAMRYGEPGRPAIGRAVRRLAQVEGKDATREALLDLAAICTTWAERLGAAGAMPAEVAEAA